MKPCSLLQLTSCPQPSLLACRRLLWSVSEPVTKAALLPVIAQAHVSLPSSSSPPPGPVPRRGASSWLPGPSVPAWLVPAARARWAPALLFSGRAHPRSCRSSLSAAAGPPRCLSRPALSAAFPALSAVQTRFLYVPGAMWPAFVSSGFAPPSAQSWCPFTGTVGMDKRGLAPCRAAGSWQRAGIRP